MLENGGLVFDGEVNEAVDCYISDASFSIDKRITDSITYKKDYLDIKEIRINGTTANRVSLEPRQEFLDIVIIGTSKEALKCEVKFIIKKMDGTPMAALIEGRYTGHLIDVKPGQFEIVKQIRLPKYLADGDYIIDLDLHQPMVQDFFCARGCMALHIEGYYEKFARSLRLNEGGFIGLESGNRE